MKQVGVCFRVVLSIGFVAVSINVRAQAAPPPDMPSKDAIQRLMEEERRLRVQGLNNPITQEAIANAQRVDLALADIGRKAQSDLLATSQLAQQASQAARNVDAISKYRMAIILENDFKVYATAKLKVLLRADHPVYVKALNTLELPMRDIRAGYLKVTQVMVEAAWQRNEFDDARGFIMDTLGWLPDNADLQALLRESEKLNAAFVKREPSPDASSMRDALANRDREINRLLKDGRFHYEMRDLANAKLNFDRVLLLDGRNDVASNFLRMINKFKNDAAKDSRDRNFSAMVQEVNEKWIEAPHQRTLPIPNPTWINQTGGSANQPGGPGANNVIMNKLQSIRVPSVPPLAGMALNEVVNLITQMAAENDTISLDQKDKGINIWIRTDLPEYAKIAGNFPFQGSPNINPANGLPMRRPVMKHAGGSMADGTDSGVLAPGGRMNAGLPSVPTIGGGRLDPTRITVQGLTAPLTNVSLSQLLNIITKSCDQPIDWKVSEGTVMLSYRPADADFVTKLFQVKPNAFFTELIKVKPTVRQISPQPKTHLGEGFDSAIRSKNTQSNGGGNLYINRQTGQPINGGGGWAGGGGAGGGVGGVNQAASAAVQAYLANFGITNAQVVFNPSNGQLLVRAQLANLEQIEQVIEILNTSPEQLVIEAKFAEIEFNEGESLGFDWYLGNFTMQNGKYITGAGPQPTFIGKPTASNPSGFFPYPGTLQGNTFVPSQYSILPSENEGHLTSGFKGYGNPLWTFTGLMTDPQFRMVLNAIDQQDGAELLSAPRILAISGRQATISVQDDRAIVTGLEPAVTPGVGGGFGGGGGAAGGTLTPTVELQQMGPSLTVLPYVNADGYTIEMSIAPSITEFLGYEESSFEASVFAGGNVVTQSVPLPRIRTRALNVQCVVWDQTVLALGGLIAETVQTTKDKVPYLGDLPFLGRLWRGEGRSSKKKNMVIYVKPTIIDPAGNPKNRPGQLPFARTTSPDPVTFINPDNPNANLGGAGAVPGGGAPGGINNKLLNRSNYRR